MTAARKNNGINEVSSLQFLTLVTLRDTSIAAEGHGRETRHVTGNYRGNKEITADFLFLYVRCDIGAV